MYLLSCCDHQHNSPSSCIIRHQIHCSLRGGLAERYTCIANGFESLLTNSLTSIMARPPNLTGFDMQKLVTSSRSGRKDAWARMYEFIQATGEIGSSNGLADAIDHREQWRYTGPFTRFNRFKSAFPGLGIATVAFAAYCGFEYFFLSNDDHGHSETSKSEGHH